MTEKNQNPKNIKKKRELLRVIISNLLLIYEATDSQIEAIPLNTLHSMNITAYDFLKWSRLDHMERHAGKLFLEKVKEMNE